MLLESANKLCNSILSPLTLYVMAPFCFLFFLWFQLLVRTSSQDASLTLPFTVPTVMSMTSLLRQGEGLITNPHHVTMVLGALQAVPLDHLSPPVYQAVFLAIHEALFAIIQCHPQV